MHRSLPTGLCALALTLFATEATAQRYMLRKPPELNDEFSVTTTVMSPCTAKFGNLGNVLDSTFTDGLNAASNGGAYIFHDGYVAKDNTSGTDRDDGKTYFFKFSSLVQVSDSAGNPDYAGEYVKFSSVKAESTTGTFQRDADSGTMIGMELDWTHYFDPKHRVGIVAGLNNSGFSMSKSADWNASMEAHSYLFKGEKLEGLDGFTGAYARPIVFSPGTGEAYIFYGDDPIDAGTTSLGTTSVSGAWKLNASFMNFKLGGVYNLALSRRFIMRFSGGLSLIGASSRFRWDEKYSAPLDSGTVAIESSGTKTTMKLLFGAWGDIGAHYRVNRKLSFYSALQAQLAQSYSDTTKYGHRIDIDCSSTYMMRTGFTWAF